MNYQKFKEIIFMFNDYKCVFCGSKAINTIYIKDNVYTCVPYKLDFINTKSVCLRCYYKKLKIIPKKISFNKPTWKNKK